MNWKFYSMVFYNEKWKRVSCYDEILNSFENLLNNLIIEYAIKANFIKYIL